MKKIKIITILVAAIAVLFLLFALFTNYKQSNYMEQKQKDSQRITAQIIDGKIILFRKLISKRVNNSLYTNEKLKSAIVKNNQTQYQKKLKELYKLLKRENKFIKTLHFISNKNISLYRAHKPKKFGDDLTYLRDIVRETNKKKRALYGFEGGLYDFVYRLDIPVVYDGKYYGILEVGVDPFIFVDGLTVIDKYLDVAVLIKKEQIKNYVDYKNVKNIIYESKMSILVGKSDIFKSFDDDKILEKQKNISFNNQHYKMFSYNLYNFDGKVKGQFIFSLNVTDDYKWQKNNAINIILLVILIILAVLLVTYYSFSYYERKIKKLTEQEKQQERRLHQQSKMASMGEMIGNIAHQWRQPLSSITTAASGLQVQSQYGLLDEKKMEESTELIISQAEYMSKTIDDFRNFFKSDKEKVTFSLDNLLIQDLKLVEASLKSNNIEIITNFNSHCKIVGLQNELTQSIINIFNNAKDQLISLPKGSVRFIEITSNVKGKTIEVNVIDNGGGIPQKVISKIFEPYFTTKHQSQGTGIGLYMTHEIITKHFNGSIEAKNIEHEYKDKVYKCACFKVTLPLE